MPDGMGAMLGSALVLQVWQGIVMCRPALGLQAASVGLAFEDWAFRNCRRTKPPMTAWLVPEAAPL